MTVTRQKTMRDRCKVRVPIDQDVKELIESGHKRRDREADVEKLYAWYAGSFKPAAFSARLSYERVGGRIACNMRDSVKAADCVRSRRFLMNALDTMAVGTMAGDQPLSEPRRDIVLHHG